MKGTGRSYGAISVLNAIPLGIGSTMGVALSTVAIFSDETDATRVTIPGNEVTDDTLVRTCVRRTLERIGRDPDMGYEIRVESRIPPSRGLKSSSSVCNAVIGSVLDAYGTDMPKMDILRLGAECSKEAGVTITGAFDDLCGCHLGGIVFTDNTVNSLLFRGEVPTYDVLIYTSDRTVPKDEVYIDDYMSRRGSFENVLEVARMDPLRALTMNGRLMAEILDMDTGTIDQALEMGALAAGISGTGPAITIVTEFMDGYRIEEALGVEANILTVTR